MFCGLINRTISKVKNFFYGAGYIAGNPLDKAFSAFNLRDEPVQTQKHLFKPLNSKEYWQMLFDRLQRNQRAFATLSYFDPRFMMSFNLFTKHADKKQQIMRRALVSNIMFPSNIYTPR